MVISARNKRLWLWLYARGGYWTVQQVAQRTGEDSDEVFAALIEMSRRRRGLVHQVRAEHGERRLRYGVTEECQIPSGLTVAELRKHKRANDTIVIEIEKSAPPPFTSAATSMDLLDLLSPSERAYLHHDVTLMHVSPQCAHFAHPMTHTPQLREFAERFAT